jgi:hypothetical protein
MKKLYPKTTSFEDFLRDHCTLLGEPVGDPLLVFVRNGPFLSLFLLEDGEALPPSSPYTVYYTTTEEALNEHCVQN